MMYAHQAPLHRSGYRWSGRAAAVAVSVAAAVGSDRIEMNTRARQNDTAFLSVGVTSIYVCSLHSYVFINKHDCVCMCVGLIK